MSRSGSGGVVGTEIGVLDEATKVALAGEDAQLAALAIELGEDGMTVLSATSVAELHLLLLGRGPRRRTTIDAELVFRALHPHGVGALTTARLLLTDNRWGRLTDRLLRGLLRAEILTDDELDVLARELLTSERLSVHVDGQLFEGGLVVDVKTGRIVPPRLNRQTRRRRLAGATLLCDEPPGDEGERSRLTEQALERLECSRMPDLDYRSRPLPVPIAVRPGSAWFSWDESEALLGLRYGSNWVDVRQCDVLTVTTRGWYSSLDELWGTTPRARWRRAYRTDRSNSRNSENVSW